MIKLVVGAALVFGLAACNRPTLKPGDNFCLEGGGLGATKFYVVKSFSYPWVEAHPNATCAKNSPADMTFWINLEAVSSLATDCVCKHNED